MLYKLLKQSMVASTHIENFLKTPEHKLLEKTKTVRKLELQTFVLITLYSDRWRHHVCVLRSKAHDLLGTSLAAKGPGIVNLVTATTYSETRLLIQDGGRYEPNLLGSICSIFFLLLEFLRCVFTSHQGNFIFSKAFCVCSVLMAWFSLAYFLKIAPREKKSQFLWLEQRRQFQSLVDRFRVWKNSFTFVLHPFYSYIRLSWLWLRVCVYLTVWILLLQSGLWWIKVTLVCTVLEGGDLDTVMLWQVCFQILKKLQNILRAEVFWLV